MHELALMGDIFLLIEKDAKEKGIQKIKKVELLVGEISNVMPDALEMAFLMIKEQNPHFITEDAELMIETEAAQAICTLCGEEYQPDELIAFCPSCKFPSGKIISGEAFQIISYEGR